MNILYESRSCLLMVYDKYEPVIRQKEPIIDTLCFDNEFTIGRTITSKTTPLTLQGVRYRYQELKQITGRCARSRAYVMVGLSEYKSPMTIKQFSMYIKSIYNELDFAGFDVCFVQLIFNHIAKYGEERKKEAMWAERYKKAFSEDFKYEKLKIVIDHNGDIFRLPKQSYVNLWETISEDYKDWSDNV